MSRKITRSEQAEFLPKAAEPGAMELPYLSLSKSTYNRKKAHAASHVGWPGPGCERPGETLKTHWRAPPAGASGGAIRWPVSSRAHSLTELQAPIQNAPGFIPAYLSEVLNQCNPKLTAAYIPGGHDEKLGLPDSCRPAPCRRAPCRLPAQ